MENQKKGQASLFHLSCVSKSSHGNERENERQSLDAPAVVREAKADEDFAEEEKKKCNKAPQSKDVKGWQE